MKLSYRGPRERTSARDIQTFFAVFALVVLRFLYFGFKYFPQLDDYIQYHNYASHGLSIPALIKQLGLFGARPLAGLLDVTLWSWLWPCMIVSVILLSAAFAASAVIFKKIFEKLFGVGGFFAVIYALMPLGIEGTYWISASSRIVTGLLFVSLSAYSFLKYVKEGLRGSFWLSAVFQLLTFCLYEQAAVLSCALNVLIALLLIHNSERRWIMAFSCIAVAALYFGICALSGPSPLYDGRTSIILPTTTYYFKVFLKDLLSQIKSAFVGGGYYILAYGFIRGIMQIVSDGAWVYLVLSVAFAAVFSAVAYRGRDKETGKLIFPLVFGLLISLAPLAPFFIIENPWFSLRGTVTSFVGFGIIGDVMLRCIFGKNNKAMAVISSLFAVVFCICSVSELADYKKNYEEDSLAIQAVAGIKADDADTSKIAIFGLSDTYVTEQNYHFHEHITGVTESAWALTGAVRCYKNDPYEGISYIPIPTDEEYAYKRWEYEEKTLSSMDAVYCYDSDSKSVTRLDIAYLGDGDFELYLPDGTLFGKIFEDADKNAKFLRQ